ncbi:MAG: DUF4386 domain-containing protein [Gemmatimonadetes bacterium]|nr:DUF4386 domain-containing protein [Gemmatimonadota bacterium]
MTNRAVSLPTPTAVAPGSRTDAVRAGRSPSTLARSAGALLLVTMIAGAFAQGYVGARLIVTGDGAATAANILTHAPLYRLGFAVYLVEMACQVAVAVLFYELFRPVSRTGSLLAATLLLVGCVIKVMSRLFFLAPLLVLGGGAWLAAFDARQLQALALLSLRANYTAETMAMVFFGLASVVKGVLVLRSTFLPRFLGAVSVAGGVGWMLYLYEPFARQVEGLIVGTGFAGALVLVAWLLVKGVDDARWFAQRNAATASVEASA